MGIPTPVSSGGFPWGFAAAQGTGAGLVPRRRHAQENPEFDALVICWFRGRGPPWPPRDRKSRILMFICMLHTEVTTVKPWCS